MGMAANTENGITDEMVDQLLAGRLACVARATSYANESLSPELIRRMRRNSPPVGLTCPVHRDRRGPILWLHGR
jgi:hypothetical protein